MSGALSANQIADLLGRPRPTPEQRAVIEAPLEPMLVVAGAGSGKTETMAARVVYLIANGLVPPAGVLGLTFTRKAASEFADRVRRRLAGLRAARPIPGDPLVDRPTVATYNSYASALVSDHALRVGIEPTATVLTESGLWQLADEVVASWPEDLPLDYAQDTVIRAVIALAGECADHMVEPAQLAAFVERTCADVEAIPPGDGGRGPYKEVRDAMASLQARAALVPLIERFNDLKRKRDVIDFADQVALAARLARDVADVGELERERYPIVLLDEYQDTSHAQLVFLKHLFGSGHPVTAVGDPHQAIYGWRGASAGNLQRFPVDFPPATVRNLSISWRNDEVILRAANVIAAPLWEADSPSRAAPVLGVNDAGVIRPGADADGVGPPGADSTAGHAVLMPRPDASPGDIELRMAVTATEEAEAVAEFVAARRGSNPPQTCAVLCRRRAQFPIIEAALRSKGLPVEVVGLGGLLDAPEVADLVAALRVVHDPNRGDALMRLLTGARVRLGAADLHALGAWSAELVPPREEGVIDESAARSIIDGLDRLPGPRWQSATGRSFTADGYRRLTELAGLLRAMRERSYLSLPEFVGEVERAFGLDVEVLVKAVGGDPRAHLDAFREVAVGFAATSDRPTLGAFLAYLSAAYAHEDGLELPQVEPDPNAVQVLTVHAAKGLEWDVVAVPGLVDGAFPHYSGTADVDREVRDNGWLTALDALPYPLRGDRDALPQWRIESAGDQTQLRDRRGEFVVANGAHRVAEERRLAYVAVTRAARSLFLSGSWWTDGVRLRSPSRFLREVAEQVRGDGVAVRWANRPAESETNPGAELATARWPKDPLGDRRMAVNAAAALVDAEIEAVVAAIADRAESVPARADAYEEELAAGEPAVDSPGNLPQGFLPADSPRRFPPGDVPPDFPPGDSAWATDARLLLTERAARRSAVTEVPLPPHVSASNIVSLAADAREFVLDVRRPIPKRPHRAARAGIEFHQWLAHYFDSPALFDPDDLPGMDDLPDDVAVDELRRRFLASPWADREPTAVEVDVETEVAGVTVRCRIDAVFRTDDGQVEIVDWKTGRPPSDPARAAARNVQLAVYRLAWSRQHAVPLESISAAFVYVAHGHTVRPVDLLDERGLEELVTGLAPAS